jgi:hypothetical protein
MKIWFDTEFYEDGKTIELISIGLVSEDNRRLYAETKVSRILCGKSDWLKANVEPHLTMPYEMRFTNSEIAASIHAFVGEKPEFWAYYADYDWVVFCQLFGRMIDLPKSWPMFCRDVKQLCADRGNPELPKQKTGEHHALADALWTKQAWEFLQTK